MNDLLNKRLVDFTGSDLVQLLSDYLKLPEPAQETDFTKGQQFVYGRAGIAQLFGCSKTTASRIKQSGKIDKAVYQYGNTIVVDAAKALELAGKKIQNVNTSKK